MKVRTLDLRRFVAWPRLQLELAEPVSVFVGPNGAGKSSILDAVRVLLTKTARGLAKGQVARLTTWGETKSWRIQSLVGLVDEDGDFIGSTIRRTTSRVSVIDEEGTPIEITEGALVEKLTRHPKAVEAVFDVWKALRMSPEDRRALILDLAGDHAREVTDELLLELGLTTPAIRKEALAGRWKKAVTVATTARRASQGTLDGLDLSDPLDEVVGDDLSVSKVDDALLASQREALEGLREKRRALDERIGVLKAAPAPAEATPSRPERETVQDQIDELTRQIDDVDAEALVRAASDATNRIGDLTPKASAAATLAEGLEADARGLATIAEEASKRLGRAEAMKKPHECPDCGLIHEHPKAPDDETMARLETETHDAEDMASKKADEANQRKAEAERLQKELEEAAQDLERAKEGLDQLDTWGGERKALREKLEQLQDDDEAEPAPPAEDVGTLELQRKELEARIQRGKDVVGKVDAYRSALAELEERKAKAKRLRQKIEDLQAQEDLCRPDREGNIPAKLLEPVLGPIRERLARWTGSALFTSEGDRPGVQVAGVDLDDSFAPVVVGTDGERYPVETVNASAEWRVGFALAAALADLSGLRFLALDEVTYLDQANRAGLLAALLETREDFDQVLVCAVQSGQVVQPPVEDVRFYAVEASGVTQLADGECWPVSDE